MQFLMAVALLSAAHRRGEWRQQDSLLAEATSSFGDPSMVRQVPPLECSNAQQTPHVHMKSHEGSKVIKQ
jgi:hypothetical protein